jgi:hypothetical protein
MERCQWILEAVRIWGLQIRAAKPDGASAFFFGLISDMRRAGMNHRSGIEDYP